MFSWIRTLFGRGPARDSEELRAVPGAGAYRSQDGKVIYNALDPCMGKFIGRCVGAVKKAGVKAKGTSQFSILLGDQQRSELRLDEFWQEFQESEDEGVFQKVANAAKDLVSQ